MVCWYKKARSCKLKAMKTALKTLALLTVLAAPVALAQDTGTTGSGTPLVEDKANPSNKAPGTDWGWLGLAGLLGLGGLAGRRYAEPNRTVPVDSLRVEEARDPNRR